MAITLPSLCGPTYALQNQYAAIERCINFYPTPNETGGDETKYRATLDQCPGNAPFGQLPVPIDFAGPVRGMLEYQGTLYGVSGPIPTFSGKSVLWSMDGSGNYTAIRHGSGPGLIPLPTTNTGPVSMTANAIQIFIADGTNAFVYQPGTGLLVITSGLTGYIGANHATFQDGYILALSTNAQQFQISGTSGVPIGDATQWDPANVSFQGGQADLLQTIISSREYVRLLGARRSQVYYNAGANGIGGFPFQSYNETFIETGIAANWSLQDLGDSLVWIGQDARGIRAAWRDFGFQPQRVSTFAIEQAWQSYSVISDAIGMVYTWKGHTMWQITFPTAGHTWVFDATASQLAGRPVWHERTFGDLVTRRPELFCANCYNEILVGSDGTDGNPGAVYQMADTYSDCAQSGGVQGTLPQIPQRIVPHIYESANRTIINRMRVSALRPMNLQVSRTGTTPSGPVFTGRPVNGYAQLSDYGGLGYARDWVMALTGDGTANANGLVTASIDIQELAS